MSPSPCNTRFPFSHHPNLKSFSKISIYIFTTVFLAEVWYTVVILFIQDLARLTPLFYYKIVCYKIISISFGDVTVSHSSTPCGILGEKFKLNCGLSHPHSPPPPHAAAGLAAAGPCVSRRGNSFYPRQFAVASGVYVGFLAC